MTLMAGKNGLVTASGGGIGRVSALAFAREGARVLVSDIDDDAGRETVDMIRSAGGTAEYLAGDAAEESSAIALVDRVVELWGRLDFAHNNAGIGSPTKPVSEQEGSDWERAFRINLFGMMYAMKHQIRRFQEQKTPGAIVNTASIAGVSANAGLSPYNSSKWGVLGLTQTAATENAADGIRINAIMPGATLTAAIEKWAAEVPDQYEGVLNGIPMKRMGTPDEQANAAVWLCSEQASYITGVALPVDGGLVLRR